MAKKKNTSISAETVNTAERAAFEKMQEMQEAAFRQGGLLTVLGACGASFNAYKTMLKMCGDQEMDSLTGRSFAASYLLAEFFPSRIAKLEQMPVDED